MQQHKNSPGEVVNIDLDQKALSFLNAHVVYMERQVHAARGLSLLSPLINDWSYLPVTDSAPGPQFFVHLFNDIIINQKKEIIEFGSGISTILLARFLAKNHINARVLSVDHDDRWQDIVANCLKADGIEQNIQFICSPVIKGAAHSWYDKSRIGLPEDFIADTVVVDGPIGNVPLARFGAVPFIKDHLSKSCYTIYLHDTDRPDEQEILRCWHALLPDSAVHTSGRYAVLMFGTKYTFAPQTLS